MINIYYCSNISFDYRHINRIEFGKQSIVLHGLSSLIFAYIIRLVEEFETWAVATWHMKGVCVCAWVLVLGSDICEFELIFDWIVSPKT